jgi:hypothetical protein
VAAKAAAGRTAAQKAASSTWAAAGRASQKNRANKARMAGQKSTRTKAQHAASVRAAAAGRAAQAARRAGKVYVSTKKPKAPAPDTWTRSGVRLGEVSLYDLPACAAAALAEHLMVWTGAYVPEGSVLEMHRIVQPATLADVLEYARVEGFPGTREKLAHFEPCDPDIAAPGLIYGVTLPEGYHAVFTHACGMASWGQIMPLAGRPAEAWWLEWEAEQ